MTDHSAPVRPRRGWTVIFVLASALVLALLIGLGTWQVQRLQWKEELMATIAERLASPPRSLADLQAQLTTTGDIEYRPVEFSGVFHHEAERHFFATHQGRSGYYVYTPLEFDEGRYLLVNRGFVPFEQKDAATRTEGQVRGTVGVIGLARERLAEKPSWLVPDNDPEKNVFYWKDWEAMIATSGVGSTDDYLPFFVDANDAPNPGGLPLGGVTIIDMPNNHLQYAITWYGLALALAAVFAAWLAREYRRRRSGGAT